MAEVSRITAPQACCKVRALLLQDALFKMVSDHETCQQLPENEWRLKCGETEKYTFFQHLMWGHVCRFAELLTSACPHCTMMGWETKAVYRTFSTEIMWKSNGRSLHVQLVASPAYVPPPFQPTDWTYTIVVLKSVRRDQWTTVMRGDTLPGQRQLPNVTVANVHEL